METSTVVTKKPKKINEDPFTMEDVREAIANRHEQVNEQPKEETEKSDIVELKQDILKNQPTDIPQQQQKVKAASIADILGFNPQAKKTTDTRDKDPSEVPQKFRKYYKMLLRLKRELKDGLNRLTKTPPPDEDPELAKFDSGFALSLLSNEQESLTEIEHAIHRIYDGTYGICEATGLPIEPKRLEVVPFTRYSLAGQEEQEKKRVTQENNPSGAIFGNEHNEDVTGFTNYEE